MPEDATSARLDELHLWFLGQPAAPQWVGELRLMTAGKGVSLTYAPAWIDNGFALSEDLPLVAAEHLPRTNGVAAGAVDDARPDRWGERVIQLVDKPKRLSLMEYLHHAGDDRFGALGVSTSKAQYLPRLNGPLPQLQNAQALGEAVAKVNARQAVNAIERRLLAAGGSLGGVKPKALINIDGQPWVIKFFNNEPIDAPLVEHASMTLARKAGITTAETRVIRLTGENALAVRRFDRVNDQRVHCISAGTALRASAAPGQEPDLGYPNLAQLLRRAGVAADSANQRDMRDLFRRMAFNILIDNTDDHEKNHALMVVEPYRHGSLRLAPAFDVLPTNSGQGHQEFTVGALGRDSTLANAMSQCALFGLQPTDAADEIAKVIAVVGRWRKHFKGCGVTDADIDSLAQRIDGDELLAQRRNFRAAGYPAPANKARRSPFR